MQASCAARAGAAPLGVGATAGALPHCAWRAPALRRAAGFTRCSVARDVDTEPSTSGREAADAAPTSWPSAAARKAAYSGSDRAPALDVPAQVSGCLPAWLNGTYIRNGPGDLLASDNMFDGFGMLLKFEIDGASNRVTGSHRFVESKAWKHYAATGKLRWREFATAPKYESLGERLADVANTVLGTMGLSQGVTDNASVNVVPLQDGSAVAMTETVQGTFRVDPATLETLGQVRYQDGISGDLTTAHPQPMPNGDLINLLSAVGVGLKVYRHPAGAFERRQLIATLAHRRPLAPAWIHDFPATATHAVLPEMPLYFNLPNLISGGTTDYIFMDWIPSDGTTLHAVDLRTGAAKRFRAPPFFVFHWANAFHSEGGRFLHLDASLYDDPGICNDLYLAPLRADYRPGAVPGRAWLRRITLDLDAPDGSDVVSIEPLVADEATACPPFDFPKVSPLLRGQPHRYVWGACSVRPTSAHNAVAKFDTQQKTVQIWHESGTLVGEPAFVPAPGATAEDDGVVLTVLVQADGSAALSVLDGRTLTEVARAQLPGWQLTIGFHGCFIPRAA
ncbi:hypothetical protein ABPG75_009965 [Micractinium tetrahymenae]